MSRLKSKQWTTLFVAAFIISTILSIKFVGADTQLATSPDYSSVKKLAISLSYPVVDGGSKRDPRSLVAGGAGDQKNPGKKFVSPALKEAHKRATRIGTNKNRPTLTPSKRLSADLSMWANCSSYVGIVVINTLDKNFPGFSARQQREYMSKSSNGWVRISTISSPTKYTPEKYKAGDVFVTRDKIQKDGRRVNHVFLWVGKHAGATELVSSASHGSPGGTGKLPALYTNKTNKPDALGRTYDVYRYVGTSNGSKAKTTTKLKFKSGKATVTDSWGINIRTNPSVKSKIVGVLAKGKSLKYDGYVDTAGYRWLSFKKNGKRYYVAQGPGTKMSWVTGGVK